MLTVLASATFLFFCILIFREQDRLSRRRIRHTPTQTPDQPAPTEAQDYAAYLAAIRAQIASQNQR